MACPVLTRADSAANWALESLDVMAGTGGVTPVLGASPERLSEAIADPAVASTSVTAASATITAITRRRLAELLSFGRKGGCLLDELRLPLAEHLCLAPELQLFPLQLSTLAREGRLFGGQLGLETRQVCRGA